MRDMKNPDSLSTASSIAPTAAPLIGLRALLSVAFGLSSGLIFWLLIARIAHSAPPSAAWIRSAITGAVVFVVAAAGLWMLKRSKNARQKHPLTLWLVLVQGALLGALTLTAMIPAGAPMMSRICVALLAIAIILKLVWQFKTAGAPPNGLSANSASVLKIGVFALTFALPFAVINIDARLAFIAAIVCAIGCVIDRWMLFKG